MGVEFIQRTAEHRVLLEKFLGLLTANRDVLPELMVEPEGLEVENSPSQKIPGIVDLDEDALLGLFRNQAELSAESFLEELRKQRGLTAASAAVIA